MWMSIWAIITRVSNNRRGRVQYQQSRLRDHENCLAVCSFDITVASRSRFSCSCLNAVSHQRCRQKKNRGGRCSVDPLGQSTFQPSLALYFSSYNIQRTVREDTLNKAAHSTSEGSWQKGGGETEEKTASPSHHPPRSDRKG